MFDLFPIEGALREATDRLYWVFAKYPKPPVESCVDTFFAPISDAAMSAWTKSVWAYTSAEAAEFAQHSLSCDLSPEKRSARFRFWLPRLIEGMASKSLFGVVFDDWYVIAGLNKAGWHAWPEAEIRAIHDWVSTWIDSRFSDDPAGRWDETDWVEEPIKFAVGIGFDPTANLKTALKSFAPVGLRMTAFFVRSLVEEAIPRTLLADANTPGVLVKRKIVGWLLRRSTVEQLERPFFKLAELDPETAGQLSSAIEWLSNLRESYLKSPPKWFAGSKE